LNVAREKRTGFKSPSRSPHLLFCERTAKVRDGGEKEEVFAGKIRGLAGI
jgi:hypothetical protein